MNVSKAQKISGTHRAYVAGQPEDLARIPEIEREGGFDKRKVVSFKAFFDGADPAGAMAKRSSAWAAIRSKAFSSPRSAARPSS